MTRCLVVVYVQGEALGDFEIVEGNKQHGRLCFRQPWPGLARTVYGDHKRYLQTYMKPYKGLYFTGDGAYRDEDGYLWITGRVDGKWS